MSETAEAPGQLEEREYLLQACFGLQPLQARTLAQQMPDEQFATAFEEALAQRGELGFRPTRDFPREFVGRYYTIRDGQFQARGGWPQFRESVIACLAADSGPTAKGILEIIVDAGSVTFPVIKSRFQKHREALDVLLGNAVIQKVVQAEQVRYALVPGTARLVRELITDPSLQVGPTVWVNSELAKDELEKIEEMDREFAGHVEGILGGRLPEVTQFGRFFSVRVAAAYFRRLFGPDLYFDALLALAHQYALCDIEVRNAEGGVAMQTGFNLALFGAPGTGKTFAVSDLMCGAPHRGVPAHGLPGRNRHCGGMTPAFFIRIGEAYQGRKFNFLVTEFNDWFKYKGMVEPLKLALDHGTIRWETKTERVGPYKFASFLSTNYNTRTLELGYQTTVSDPNFNAIEDRMLCRLHRMTKERYEQIAQSQRQLALGQMDMDLAHEIQDHLTLVYAIQTQHEAVRDRHPKRPIELTAAAYDRVTEARQAVMAGLKDKQVPFSARLERRALQLASALSLLSYFSTKGDRLPITSDALDFALKFFVEEASVRSQERFDPAPILAELGLDRIDQAEDS